MPLPSLDQYNDAVQHPKTAFRDSQLQTGRVQLNGLGLPLALSGGFALTYNVTCPNGRQYAVRCFHRQTERLEQRYKQIATRLKETRSLCFVECEYLPDGIQVNREWHPIVKMEWAKGRPLGALLERAYSDGRLIARLRERFANLSVDLRQQGIAHGDLQNGNVMVDGDSLRLIDYDGMYVKGMATGSGSELGHKHFQHPCRSPVHFGPEMDRFSFIVIDFSLHILSVTPTLFEKYSNGENILFTANDFAQPHQSSLFQELLANPHLARIAARFAAECAGDIRDVPTVDEFARGVGIAVGKPGLLPVGAGQLQRPQYNGALPVVSGDDYWGVQRNIGNRLEVIGRIADVHRDWAMGGKPYIFVSFGDWRDNIVKINIWPEGLEQLRSKPEDNWVGKWISVTGLVDPAYTSPRFGYTHLSITVTEQSQLHLISKEEAEYRLGISPGKTAGDTGGTGSAARPSPPHKVPTRRTGPRERTAPSGKQPSAVGSATTRPKTTATEAHNQQGLDRLRQLRQATAQGGQQPASGTPPSKPGNTGCLVALLMLSAVLGLGAICRNSLMEGKWRMSSDGIGSRSSDTADSTGDVHKTGDQEADARGVQPHYATRLDSGLRDDYGTCANVNLRIRRYATEYSPRQHRGLESIQKGSP